jgi:putative ABC transport system substrate-binding protein
MPSRLVITIILIALLAAPLDAGAQSTVKIPRIGFLGAASASGYASQLEAFRQGLRALGYVEGQNITIEYRWAEGKYDRLAALAAELVALKVDVILTHGTPGTQAANEATTTIPIVVVVAGDAVATGLVQSLARPGGNAIHGLVPRELDARARVLGVTLQYVDARGVGDFDRAFETLVNGRSQGLVVVDDGMLIANATRLVELATRSRLPMIGFTELAGAGALMSYGVSFPELWRQAPTFVDKILKGARPSELPIEQASRFELVLNLKAAKTLGLTIPPSVLARADEVIQ